MMMNKEEKEKLKDLLEKFDGPILITTVPNMKIPCTTESLNKMVVESHLWVYNRTAEQMKIFEVALSAITDLEILIKHIESCIHGERPEEEQLLENRLSEVLSNTNDLRALCHCRNRAQNRKVVALIESRTIEVIQSTTDFNTLFNYWLGLNAGIGTTELQVAIKEKLEQIIREVSIDNMPEWFVELIQLGNIRTPKIINNPFKEKIKQLITLILID